VVAFLLRTEIIPLCLRIMESGTELSKTVAVFILEKIIMDKQGLNYVCATAERFYAVATVLKNMVVVLVTQPSVRLLKHVIRCFLRLADHPKAREALKGCLPEQFRDGTFSSSLEGDLNATKWLQSLVDMMQPLGGA
jgi:CCR4-NOT transcription complex subunit 9